MKAATFAIEGMHCAGCARTIQSILSAEPGVGEASVSYDDREARILFEPRLVSEERLIAAIRDVGYAATRSTP